VPLIPEKGGTLMSRRVGQIVARGERCWLVRVYLGGDLETRKRMYHNRTIYGSLRHAQAYLTKRLHERDLCRGVAGLQVTLDEFLDHWLKTAVKPKGSRQDLSGLRSHAAEIHSSADRPKNHGWAFAS
jgi:hypothetical protein